MTPKDYLIARLKALCRMHGPEAVADKAGVSGENLKQILAGTKLKSGRPRGVGPALQGKLDAAYPGWSGLSAAPPAKPPAGFKDRRIVSETDWAILEDVKLVLAEEKLADLRKEAQRIRSAVERIIKDRM